MYSNTCINYYAGVVHVHVYHCYSVSIVYMYFVWCPPVGLNVY